MEELKVFCYFTNMNVCRALISAALVSSEGRQPHSAQPKEVLNISPGCFQMLLALSSHGRSRLSLAALPDWAIGELGGLEKAFANFLF